MPKTKNQTICKHIFKDGSSTTSREQFTGAWIALIRQLEKTKQGGKNKAI